MIRLLFGLLLSLSSPALAKTEEILVDEIDYFDAIQMQFSATTPIFTEPSAQYVELSVTTDLVDAVFDPKTGYLKSGTVKIRVWQNYSDTDTSFAETDWQHCVRVDMLQAVETALKKAKVTFFDNSKLRVEKPPVNNIGPSLESCLYYEPINAE